MMNVGIPTQPDELLEFKDQLRRWANLQRLEGNYVAAQETERQLVDMTAPSFLHSQAAHA